MYIIIFTPTDLYTFDKGRTFNFRIGYFADEITESKIPISGISSFVFNIKNCYTYILENKDSSSNIKLYISANRQNTFDSSASGTTHTTTITSDIASPRCFVEIRVPGGVTIPSLTFNFKGDTSPDTLLRDYKESSTWTSTMTITTMSVVVSNSAPKIFFKNSHTIGTLSISGDFCICSFDTVSITVMTFDIDAGSLYINQNSAITENKLVITTPYGTHCAAAAFINSTNNGN